MHDPAQLLRALPLEVFETPKPDDDWTRSPLTTISDAMLIQSVAVAIAAPKVEVRSSFALHAPLELLARAWLLPYVSPDKRDDARRRIAEIAVRYAGEGPEIEPRPRGHATADRALVELLEALHAGDADTVDSSLLFLLSRVSPESLRAALADAVIPSLGAAAHAPILLMALPGAVRYGSADICALLRAPLRSLALEADQRLTWMDAVEPHAANGEASLFGVLSAPARVKAASFSIAPTMLAVERDGYAARLLAEATSAMTVRRAELTLLPVAALSMLQDDPEQAPYGWTHCLTLPQAILAQSDAVSDQARLVRIAATHVLGFRATMGCARLQQNYAPPPPRSTEIKLIGDPGDVAALVFHAATGQQKAVANELAARAAVHADAHLAKYTMACLLAAARAPDIARLYLAAAAYLGAWWGSREYVPASL
jgi:hypothetical protein